jgi:hypothetical protein
MSHKPGTIALIQLLQNVLNMWTIHADANPQTFLSIQKKGLYYLWCKLAACSQLALEAFLLGVPELRNILYLMYTVYSKLE